MTGHFSLTLDIDSLDDAARKLGLLAAHLQTKATSVGRTPADIGDHWTGKAATAVKAEMTGLGGHMQRFHDQLTTSKGAVTTLAGDYQHALDQLRGLNQRWDAAQTAYDTAVGKAAKEHTQAITDATPRTGPLNRGIRNDIDQAQSDACSTAYQDRATAWQGLEKEFATLHAWVRQRTAAAGRTLGTAVPLPVPPKAITAYLKSGAFPPSLDHAALEDGMALTRQLDKKIGSEVTEGERKSLIDQLEPYRRINDLVHTGWDFSFVDQPLERLLKEAEDASGPLAKEAERAATVLENAKLRVQVLQALRDSGHATPENISELSKLEGDVAGLESAAGDTASAASQVSRLATSLNVLRYGIGGTAFVGDVLTVIDPPDKGAMGWVDRGAAGANGAMVAWSLAPDSVLAALNMTDEIPVWGEVVMVGTALYLGGNFLYHNWPWFHDVCDDIGHGAVSAVKWTGHEAVNLYHDAGHLVNDVADAGESVLHDTGHAISSGWHAVTSWL